MADVGLRIRIGADISQAVNGIVSLTETITGIGPAGNAAVTALNKIPAALRPVNPAQLQSLSAAVQRLRQDIAAFPNKPVPNPFRNIPKGADQASNALTNLGRVAQDAPFGFIGIANNLNPLLESFQRLRKETGSNRAALAALGSSLTGAGGIGLALSAVTAAFSFASLGLSAWTRGFGDSKKTLEGYAKAIDDANKKAGEEIARVQVLNAVITDNTRKQSERKDASKELSDILKDLNIKMDQEAILNGKVAEATQRATLAIIERGKARAIEARIGELSGEQLQRDLKKNELTNKLTETQKKYNAQLANRNKIANKDQREAAGIDQFLSISAIGDIRKDISDLDKETVKANKEIAFLIGQIKTNDLNIDLSKGAAKDVDLLQQRIAALKELQSLTGLDAKQRVELAQLEIKLAKRDAVKSGITKAELQQKIQGILEQAFPVGTFEFETVVTTRVNALEPSKVQIPKILTEGQVKDIAKAIGLDKIEIPAPNFTFINLGEKTKAALADLNNAINSIAQNIQVEAFSSIGDAIGAALTGGNVGDIFKGFLGLLADGLKQLGKALISYGLALAGFRIAVKTLNPVVAIAAGAAAVIAGSLVKAALPKFAEGGIATGPVIGQVGERFRPEVVLPLDRLPQLFKQIGGDVGGGTQLIPIINNEGLYLAMKRGERSAGRKF